MVGGVAKQRERKGNFYVESRLKLEAEVNGLLQNLQLLEEEKQRTAAKEQVLVKLVAQQNVMLEKLKQLKVVGPAAVGTEAALVQGPHSSSNSSTLPQQGIAVNPVTGAYLSPFLLKQDHLQLLVGNSGSGATDNPAVQPGDVIRVSPFQITAAGDSQVAAAGLTSQEQQGYLFRLLEAATQDQWDRAVNMNAMEWCQLYTSAVAHLVQYNDVIMPSPEQQQQQDGCGAATATAAEHLPSEVQQIVDNFYTHVAIILTTNNTMPYRLAAHVDLSTGNPIDNLPASHWQHVVAALQLSPSQQQQLQATWGQFRRAKQQLKQQQVEVGRKMGAATNMKAVRWGIDGAAAAEVHKDCLASMLDMDSPTEVASMLRLDSEDSVAASKELQQQQQQSPPTPAAGGGNSSTQFNNAAAAMAGGPDPMFLMPEWAGAEVIAQQELSKILTATDMVMTMQSCYVVNHLNLRQLAYLLVRSYPVLPRVAAILEALSESHPAKEL